MVYHAKSQNKPLDRKAFLSMQSPPKFKCIDDNTLTFVLTFVVNIWTCVFNAMLLSITDTPGTCTHVRVASMCKIIANTWFMNQTSRGQVSVFRHVCVTDSCATAHNQTEWMSPAAAELLFKLHLHYPPPLAQTLGKWHICSPSGQLILWTSLMMMMLFTAYFGKYQCQKHLFSSSIHLNMKEKIERGISFHECLITRRFTSKLHQRRLELQRWTRPTEWTRPLVLINMHELLCTCAFSTAFCNTLYCKNWCHGVTFYTMNFMLIFEATYSLLQSLWSKK